MSVKALWRFELDAIESPPRFLVDRGLFGLALLSSLPKLAPKLTPLLTLKLRSDLPDTPFELT
jgi:hypothetical protein